jgi:predicted MFS family arabinose efflux permease
LSVPEAVAQDNHCKGHLPMPKPDSGGPFETAWFSVTTRAAAGRSKKPPKQFTWQILVITFVRLLLNIARRFIYPFAPALSRDLQVPLTAITSLIAVNQTTGLLGLLAGPMADRWGFRNMMLAGVTMLSVGMLLCWISPVYGVVFFGLTLAGAAKTTFDPAVQAFIGQRVPFARRGFAIGVIETAWAGSTLIGIPAMAILIEAFGLRWAFLCMAVLGAVGGCVMVNTIPPDSPAGSASTKGSGVLTSLAQLIKVRPAAGMLCFGFWISLANDNLFVVYGAWLEGRFAVSLLALGVSTSVIGVAELIGESLTATLGDRIGLKRAVIFGLILATVAYLLLPVIGTTLPLALGGLFFIFFAFEFTIVSSFGLTTEILPGARATMMAGGWFLCRRRTGEDGRSAHRWRPLAWPWTAGRCAVVCHGYRTGLAKPAVGAFPLERKRG